MLMWYANHLLETYAIDDVIPHAVEDLLNIEEPIN